MPETHERRRERLLAELAARDLDAALVTKLVNVRYLSGFSGSNGGLLVSVDAAALPVLVTDGRYDTQAADEAPDVERVIERAVAAKLAALAAERGCRAVGLETHDVTLDLSGQLRDAAPGVEWRSLERAVEALRVVKDEAEVAAIREACAIADRAFADVVPTLGPGRTEREVAAALESAMRRHGADGPSFDTIVASGPHAAVPHHQPTDRPLGRGELLKLDFGALHAGYHSDMTRTVVLGPAADWQRDVYTVVAEAQRAGREMLAAGVPGKEVDARVRDVIASAGMGERFIHGLGHGVGLEIHEAPALGQTSTDTLAACMVVTVEPGVYLPGQGGVRIEDTLVVPEAGPPELLTTTPKDLLEL